MVGLIPGLNLKHGLFQVTSKFPNFCNTNIRSSFIGKVFYYYPEYIYLQSYSNSILSIGGLDTAHSFLIHFYKSLNKSGIMYMNNFEFCLQKSYTYN